MWTASLSRHNNDKFYFQSRSQYLGHNSSAKVCFYQGLAMDRNGLLLAVRSDKVADSHHRCPHAAWPVKAEIFLIVDCILCSTSVYSQAGSNIQVFNYQDGTLHSVIDSYGSKLKRPTGWL